MLPVCRPALSELMVSAMKRTEPSTKQNIAPPGCWLLKAPLLVGWFNLSDTAELTVFMAPPPPGPHHEGHEASFCRLAPKAVRSPMAKVLLVPSVTSWILVALSP